MGRTLRTQVGGLLYHVLNRASQRVRLFAGADDYASFVRVLAEAQGEQPMRLLADCVLPNPWHLLLWPEHDRELSRFVGRLTFTHTQRWHAQHGAAGSGHLYQGRFESFPVEADAHWLTVWRQVQRNPLRARLVERAEEWRWGSAWQRHQGEAVECPGLAAGPLPLPAEWLSWVNLPQTAAEEAAIRRSVRRGQPFGSAAWVAQTVKDFRLPTTLRSRGRPRKPANPAQRFLFGEKGS